MSKIKGALKIFIICNNDDIRYAVVGDEERAKLRMQALKSADMEKQGLSQHKIGKQNKYLSQIEEYENLMFWHLHEVNGE